MTNVIWGYGSEDIVSRYIEDFKGKDNAACTFDPTKIDKNLKFSHAINVITSNHFTRTKNDLDRIFPELRLFTDFYQFVAENDIKNLFYFCHDHSEIFVLDEAQSLSSFKVVVTPWPLIHSKSSKMNLFACDMAFKNHDEYINVKIIRKAVWFVSNIKYNLNKYGARGFAFEIFKIVENCNVSIKIPEYGVAGVELINELLNLGIDVIPCEIPTERVLLETEIILSSAHSGIASLASYYNRPIISVLNNHPEEIERPNSFIEKNSMWIDDVTVITENNQLMQQLSKSTKIKNKKHICGVFRDDFFDNYHKELFV